MLHKPITYTNYNDEVVTEDFYFNLSRAELIEMEAGVSGGYADILMNIVKSEDNARIMAEFKKLLTMSIGKKSADGNQFNKTDEIRNAFLESEAYSELIIEFFTNQAMAAEFVNGVMPKSTGLPETPVTPSTETTGQIAIPAEGDTPAPAEEDKRPLWLKEGRDPTPQELQKMDKNEMALAYQMKMSKQP